MSQDEIRPEDVKVVGGRGAGQQPMVVIQQHGQGWWARKISWLGWLGLAICIPIIMGLAASRSEYLDTAEGLHEKFVSGKLSSENKIAVIEVSGLITDGDGFVKRQIKRVRADDKVKAVVLRINSPGGTVTGSDFIYHHLTELRQDRDLPMVVSMGGLAASGGYYIAMAVGDQPDSIFAEPTTTTGSIGVIIPHYDLSGLLKRFDIQDDSLVSHPRKQLLSMTVEMSDDDREVLNRYLNEAFERFKEIVRSGRPKFREDEQGLVDVATGEIFSAETAQQLGLVDKIGFQEAAVERAAELAGMDADLVRVVRYEAPLSLMGALGLGARAAEPAGMSEWIEMATPRAYYLSSMFPWIAAAVPALEAH